MHIEGGIYAGARGSVHKHKHEERWVEAAGRKLCSVCDDGW